MKWQVLAAAAIQLASATATAKPDYVYGPKPDWTEYKRLATAGTRALLADPEAWSIEWPNGYVPARWRKGKADPNGYFTCGVVRAIKPIGGGFPSASVVVVIDYGAVKVIDYQPRPANSMVNIMCKAIVAGGKLPPASLMEPGEAGGPDTATIGWTGVTIQTMPDGAYVTDVAAGSPAANAGLAKGMVVTSVNGLALAHLGEAMAKVLASDAAGLTLETAAGQRLELKRPR